MILLLTKPKSDIYFGSKEGLNNSHSQVNHQILTKNQTRSNTNRRHHHLVSLNSQQVE